MALELQQINWYVLSKLLGFGLLIETVLLAGSYSWSYAGIVFVLSIVVLTFSELVCGPAASFRARTEHKRS
ncbi:hypothetical protein KC906_04650 [Candidatus Kaiserbacteria bacterium]|nr:hypothetical protein [Candidatus Kaiserbacteria bacterium]